MFNADFNAIKDDENELYRLFLEHQQALLALNTALVLLQKYPNGGAAFRGLLLLAIERAENEEARFLAQAALEDYDNGLLGPTAPQ